MVTKRPPERIYLRRPFPLSRCVVVAWYGSRIEGSGKRGERNQIRSDIVFSGSSSNASTFRHGTATVSISRRGNGNDAIPLPVCRAVRLSVLRAVSCPASRFPFRYSSRVISFRSPFRCRLVVRFSLVSSFVPSFMPLGGVFVFRGGRRGEHRFR